MARRPITREELLYGSRRVWAGAGIVFAACTAVLLAAAHMGFWHWIEYAMHAIFGVALVVWIAAFALSVLGLLGAVMDALAGLASLGRR